MPSLVGRESELGAVETFLRSERPCALAIVGEPGIGKTTLWQVAVEHARAQGARVLVARPTESEAKQSRLALARWPSDCGSRVSLGGKRQASRVTVRQTPNASATVVQASSATAAAASDILSSVGPLISALGCRRSVAAPSRPSRNGPSALI